MVKILVLQGRRSNFSEGRIAPTALGGRFFHIHMQPEHKKQRTDALISAIVGSEAACHRLFSKSMAVFCKPIGAGKLPSPYNYPELRQLHQLSVKG